MKREKTGFVTMVAFCPFSPVFTLGCEDSKDNATYKGETTTDDR